jgi:predicted O-linked N-acetylglucosamine transferase (SPINDLY family)
MMWHIANTIRPNQCYFHLTKLQIPFVWLHYSVMPERNKKDWLLAETVLEPDSGEQNYREILIRIIEAPVLLHRHPDRFL